MTTTTDCTRCKGKGFGSWVVQGGICFACNGKGTRAAQVATRQAAKDQIAFAKAVELVSIVIEADTAREARRIWHEAFAIESGSPIFRQVEVGVFAAEDRMHVASTLEALR